jgi:tetratricopeptide (TPR) repeat protein
MIQITKTKFDSSDFTDDAKDLLDKGLTDEAIEWAQKRIEKFPKDKHAHWYLAQAYYEKKKYSRALEILKKLEKIAPSWKEKYIDPCLYDIKEELRSTKPEVVEE